MNSKSVNKSNINNISLKKIQSMIKKSESINCSYYSFITYYRQLSEDNKTIFDSLMFPMYCSVIPNNAILCKVLRNDNNVLILTYDNEASEINYDIQLELISKINKLFSKVDIDNLECLYDITNNTFKIIDYQCSIETKYRYNILSHINIAINYYQINSLNDIIKLEVQLPKICNNIDDLMKVMSVTNERYNYVKWMRSNEFNNNKNNIFTKSKKNITISNE